MFSPSAHVTGDVTTVSPNLLTPVAVLLADVAVTAFDAFVVAAVYAVVPELNVGDSVSEPIRSSERSAFKGL